jgi:sulfur carrier protein
VIIELNGRPETLPDGATVEDAVIHVGEDGGSRGVAVAIDGEVVHRAVWGTTKLQEQQSIEIVRAVQGG